MLAKSLLFGLPPVVLLGLALGCSLRAGARSGEETRAAPAQYWAPNGSAASSSSRGPAGGVAAARPAFGSAGQDDPYVPPPRTDPQFPAAHPRIYLNERNRKRLAKLLNDGRPSATRFRSLVDRQIAGANIYAFDPANAALLYAVTGDTRYGEYAVARIDAAVTEEEQRIAKGERPEVAGDSYLHVGERVGSLARTYDWCWNLTTSAQRKRWVAYANQAVWNVWHHQEARWGTRPAPWTGWSVDNPSNNYYYSFLEATMTLGLATHGEAPEAQGWLRQFREAKIRDELVPTFTRDLAGGGSREGTGYGTAMGRLFELYDIWEASTGERLADLTPHTRLSLPAFLHQVVPTLDRLAPVGDHARDSTAALFDYHRKYVQVLTHLYDGTALAAAGTTFLEDCSVPQMSQGFMYVYDFLYDYPEAAGAPLSRVYPMYYAPGTGQVTVRDAWARDATWVHVIAGPYTESHAHRDQGSLLVYKNEWLAFDANIASHSGIRNEEELHNLVRFSAQGKTVQMRAGGQPAQLLALTHEAAFAYVAVDVTPVYGGQTAVARAHREVLFVRPDLVIVFDRADGSGEQIWQLNTPLRPRVAGGTATLAGAKSTLTVTRVHPPSGVASVVDFSADQDLRGGGFRLEVRDASAAGRSRFLHVLDAGSSVRAVTASDESGQLGVAVTLADGRTVVARFNADAFGGTLEIRQPSGGDTLRRSLAAGVAPLPLLTASK